ncbi:hypothetical protein ACLOJK_023216 [Asimina triloba]
MGQKSTKSPKKNALADVRCKLIQAELATIKRKYKIPNKDNHLLEDLTPVEETMPEKLKEFVGSEGAPYDNLDFEGKKSSQKMQGLRQGALKGEELSKDEEESTTEQERGLSNKELELAKSVVEAEVVRGEADEDNIPLSDLVRGQSKKSYIVLELIKALVEALASVGGVTEERTRTNICSFLLERPNDSHLSLEKIISPKEELMKKAQELLKEHALRANLIFSLKPIALVEVRKKSIGKRIKLLKDVEDIGFFPRRARE